MSTDAFDFDGPAVTSSARELGLPREGGAKASPAPYAPELPLLHPGSSGAGPLPARLDADRSAKPLTSIRERVTPDLDGFVQPGSGTLRVVSHDPFTGELLERQAVGGATIHRGVSTRSYHADRLGDGGPPRLSSSIAKLLVERTPAHAAIAHPRIRERFVRPTEITVEGEEGEAVKEEATGAQLRGSLIHRLVLGRGADIVAIDAPDFRTKAAKEAKAAALAAGKLPIIASKYEPLREGASAIVARMREDYGLVLDGESEMMLTWTAHATDGTPVECRCMVDHLWPTGHAIDLKTTDDVSLDGIEKHVASYGHDIQNACYQSALDAMFGQRPEGSTFRFVFAEYDPPYSVSAEPFDGALTTMGAEKWQHALDVWAHCLAFGSWSARYSEEPARVSAKPWALTAWANRRLGM